MQPIAKIKYPIPPFASGISVVAAFAWPTKQSIQKAWRIPGRVRVLFDIFCWMLVFSKWSDWKQRQYMQLKQIKIWYRRYRVWYVVLLVEDGRSSIKIISGSLFSRSFHSAKQNTDEFRGNFEKQTWHSTSRSFSSIWLIF